MQLSKDFFFHNEKVLVKINDKGQISFKGVFPDVKESSTILVLQNHMQWGLNGENEVAFEFQMTEGDTYFQKCISDINLLYSVSNF